MENNNNFVFEKSYTIASGDTIKRIEINLMGPSGYRAKSKIRVLCGDMFDEHNRKEEESKQKIMASMAKLGLSKESLQNDNSSEEKPNKEKKLTAAEIKESIEESKEYAWNIIKNSNLFSELQDYIFDEDDFGKQLKVAVVKTGEKKEVFLKLSDVLDFVGIEVIDDFIKHIVYVFFSKENLERYEKQMLKKK